MLYLSLIICEDNKKIKVIQSLILQNKCIDKSSICTIAGTVSRAVNGKNCMFVFLQKNRGWYGYKDLICA